MPVHSEFCCKVVILPSFRKNLAESSWICLSKVPVSDGGGNVRSADVRSPVSE